MIASIRGLSYQYPNAPGPALRDVSLDIEQGQFVLLAGPSAGGKSTLLRLFNGLVPQFHGGVLEGSISVAGLDPSRTPARRMATIAGMVFQEPEAQAIADTVEDEIAFGMEQHGIDADEMGRRIDRLLGDLGIDHLRRRRLATLSGGERQRVAIAAVLALEPQLLLLDEPTSQIDPDGADAVIGAVRQLHARGLTVLIAEHRLDRLLPAAEMVLEVESGAVRSLSPRAAAAQLRSVPAVCELARRLGMDPLPLSIAELRRSNPPVPIRPPARTDARGPSDILLEIDCATVAYGEIIGLRDASLSLHQGEIVALVGANGGGKTSLLRAITGLSPIASGSITFCGQPAPARVRDRTAFAALVPQDPAIALYHETVAEEVAETLHARGRGRGRESSVLAAWNIAELASRNPRDISVGQQQRVAVGAMLAHEPPVWLLDEPTRGADGPARAWLAERLRGHAAKGGAAIVSTHDIESAARYATRVVGLDHGRVAFDLLARQAFAASGPVPTQIAQIVPGAITLEDLA